MITRRRLLIGGGAGAGLVVGYALWPRVGAPNLRGGPGETIFNAFLKIATDGRVTVVVPQAEMGQGAYTALPQIVADELGADWRTVGVEPAPPNPLYDNMLLAGEWGVRADTLTGGSSSVRMFEPPLRDAGAGARVLLCKAAAARWDVAWEACDARDGFVTEGGRRLRFGALADAAAGLELPDPVPRRAAGTGRLVGRSLPRIDTPAKLDGSARFAGDVRLPQMVHASVRNGAAVGDEAAARRVPGVLDVVAGRNWIAVVAGTWWAAEQGAAALRARGPGRARGPAVDAPDVDGALAAALAGENATRFHVAGDPDAVLAEGALADATYFVGSAPRAAAETPFATARWTGDRLEVWAGTQAPGLARAAAARAGGVNERAVTLYPTLVGGGFGRGYETAAIEQAVVVAKAVKRSVQLTWSRVEDIRHDPMRPPAAARMTARVSGAGVLGWRARIATPAAIAETFARARGEARPDAGAERQAVDGAVPPYGFGAVAVEHASVDVGVASGIWRGRAHGHTAFFTECFVDELARKAGIEPFSFRMGMLGNDPRFARVLSAAAALGQWDGSGSGSVQGIAGHACVGSVAAAVVEVGVGADQRIRVARVSMAVDVGRVINPDLVRQQVEGGILWGIAGATGLPIVREGGAPVARTLSELGLPSLTDTPDMRIEILPSSVEAGGAEEVAVPPIAPAIANAIYAATGQRLRSLPLVMGGR